ncbi:hypothetical protein DFJ74DRAFT_677763 [Hyaloraphidium curvatum]|nr:hypothetical protein DFJ74DRAFT_677763 [Hyaloraphidium curvatum]
MPGPERHRRQRPGQDGMRIAPRPTRDTLGGRAGDARRADASRGLIRAGRQLPQGSATISDLLDRFDELIPPDENADAVLEVVNTYAELPDHEPGTSDSAEVFPRTATAFCGDWDFTVDVKNWSDPYLALSAGPESPRRAIFLVPLYFSDTITEEALLGHVDPNLKGRLAHGLHLASAFPGVELIWVVLTEPGVPDRVRQRLDGVVADARVPVVVVDVVCGPMFRPRNAYFNHDGAAIRTFFATNATDQLPKDWRFAPRGPDVRICVDAGWLEVLRAFDSEQLLRAALAHRGPSPAVFGFGDGPAAERKTKLSELRLGKRFSIMAGRVAFTGPFPLEDLVRFLRHAMTEARTLADEGFRPSAHTKACAEGSGCALGFRNRSLGLTRGLRVQELKDKVAEGDPNAEADFSAYQEELDRLRSAAPDASGRKHPTWSRFHVLPSEIGIRYPRSHNNTALQVHEFPWGVDEFFLNFFLLPKLVGRGWQVSRAAVNETRYIVDWEIVL